MRVPECRRRPGALESGLGGPVWLLIPCLGVLCIFEDERFPGFFPLSLGRPVFDIGIGTQSLRGRLVDELNPESLVLLCRPYLAAILEEEESREGTRAVQVNELPEGEILFLNGRLLSYEKRAERVCAWR